MAKRLFGFKAHPDVFYRACANDLAGEMGYDPEFEISPSRLYCSYELACSPKPFISEVQRSCHLRSSVLYLLDLASPSDNSEAYIEAEAWLLKSGWPFNAKGAWSAFSFEEQARIFLATMEKRYEEQSRKTAEIGFPGGDSVRQAEHQDRSSAVPVEDPGAVAGPHL